MYFKRFLFLFVAICLGTATMATRRYVAPTGSSTYTGLNGWSNASNDLQAMINASTVGDEIWVYAGMYKPNRPFDNRQTPPPPPSRKNAFVLKAGVKIYGGFSSQVTGTLPAFNAAGRTGTSILSGDIDDDGVLNSNNAYHVVIAAGIVGDAEVILDGFTITGGYANIYNYPADQVNGKNIYDDMGAGIYCNNSLATLTNLTITGNYAEFGGGGLYNVSAENPSRTVRLSKSTVSNNKVVFGGAACVGGGIYNDGAALYIDNVVVAGNEATGTNGGGGGIYSSGRRNSANTDFEPGGEATLVISNATINGNSATEEGGGIFDQFSKLSITNTEIRGNKADNGGGINSFGGSTLDMVNVLVSGNYGMNGGGIRNYGGPGGDSRSTLINVTVSGNSGDIYGGGIHNEHADITLKNCIVAGNYSVQGGGHNLNGSNRTTVSTSLIGNSQGISYQSTGLSADDIFLNWIDPDAVGWAKNVNGNYKLKLTCADAIDTGDDNAYPSSAPAVDLAGVSRKLGQIDMGAYEAAAPNYTISLSPTAHTFTNLTYRYTAADIVPGAITVTNIGNRATGPMTIALSGTNATDFELSSTTLADIPYPGTPVTFTVKPKTGLNAGAYTATVTVSGSGFSKTVNIQLVVGQAGGVHVSQPQEESKTDVSITVTPSSFLTTNLGNQTIEYFIQTTNTAPPANALGWQAGRTFTGLQQNTTYYVFARSKENNNYSSWVSLGTPISTAPNFGGVVVVPPPANPTCDLVYLGNNIYQLPCGGVIILPDGTRVEVPNNTTVSSTGTITLPLNGEGIATTPVGGKVNITGGTQIVLDGDGKVSSVIYPGPGGATITWIDGATTYIPNDGTIVVHPTFYSGLRISAPVIPPVIRRPVTLRIPDSFISLPAAGLYYIISGSDFTFTLTLRDHTVVPKVKTNHYDDIQKTLTGKQNADGTYTFTVRQIRQPLEITVETNVSNEAVSSAYRVWSHGNQVYINAIEPSTLYIYTLAGTLHSVRQVEAGQTNILLNSGAYIVEIDGKRWKVMTN